jgi:hypothetical protein
MAIDHIYSEFLCLHDYGFFDVYTEHSRYRIKNDKDCYTITLEDSMSVFHNFEELMKNSDIKYRTKKVSSHNYLDDFHFENAVLASVRKIKLNHKDYLTICISERGYNNIHVYRTEHGFIVYSESRDINAFIEQIEQIFEIVQGTPAIVYTTLYF